MILREKIIPKITKNIFKIDNNNNGIVVNVKLLIIIE